MGEERSRQTEGKLKEGKGGDYKYGKEDKVEERGTT